MKITALHKNAAISAQKARLVINLIRGKSVGDALNILTLNPRKSAKLVKKVLESAIANAEHTGGLNVDDLEIIFVSVDKAASLKRFCARAKGRGNRIEKQTCHISIVLGN